MNTHIHQDTRVGVLVSSGETDSVVCDARTIATNSNLRARGVELGTSWILGQVEGDDFVSDQVVTCLEVLRNENRQASTTHY